MEKITNLLNEMDLTENELKEIRTLVNTKYKIKLSNKKNSFKKGDKVFLNGKTGTIQKINPKTIDVLMEHGSRYRCTPNHITKFE